MKLIMCKCSFQKNQLVDDIGIKNLKIIINKIIIQIS